MIKKFKNFLNENNLFKEMNIKHNYEWSKTVSPEEYYEVLLNSSGFNGVSFYFLEPTIYNDGKERKSVWANYFHRDGVLHTTIMHYLDRKKPSFDIKYRPISSMTNAERKELNDNMKYEGLILKKMIEDRYNIKISEVYPSDEIPGPGVYID